MIEYLIALKKKKQRKQTRRKRESNYQKKSNILSSKKDPQLFSYLRYTSNTRHASRVSSPINIAKKNIQEVGLPLCEGFDLRQSVETHKIYSQQTHTHTKSHTRSHTHLKEG